eukprot:scaffold23279_cov19-Tisochrysis_lutea.AAC.2
MAERTSRHTSESHTKSTDACMLRHGEAVLLAGQVLCNTTQSQACACALTGIVSKGRVPKKPLQQVAHERWLDAPTLGDAR